MITNIKELSNNSGIYKINYENGKIYIGQAQNIRKRANEHNSKNKYPCDKALKKYDAVLEILQENIPLEKLDSAETYWINYYNACNKDIGYNIFKEGNVSGKRGIDNAQAIFNQETLDEVIDLLINHTELSLIDIANKYGVNKETIGRISLGKSYRQDNLQYPLRNNDHSSQRKNFFDYFKNEEDIIKLKEDLYYSWNLSIEEDLAKKYNIPLKLLHKINQGKEYKEIGEYEYPIRRKNSNRNNLSIEETKEILYLLQNTKKSMKDIGEKYNIHRDTVSKINKGITNPIKNYHYPAR